MQEYAKHILSAFYYTEYLQEKKSVLDAPSQKIGQSRKESPRGDMLVKNRNILDE